MLNHTTNRLIRLCLPTTAAHLAQALLAASLLTSPLAFADLTDIQAFTQTYPQLASDELLRQVARGNALSQHELANRLSTGRNGFPTNPEAAAMWYTRAAQQGIPGSASLDPLPRGPLRSGRHENQPRDAAPVARLAAMDVSAATQLTQIVDGSASSDNQEIVSYIWDVRPDETTDGNASITSLTPEQAQIIFPSHGLWHITLIVVDAHGQIDHTTQQYQIEEASAPTTPTPLVPANSADLIIDLVTNFQWGHDSRVTSYEFHFFNNAPDGPRGPRGARQPFLTNIQPSDICSEGVCTFPQLVDLAEYNNHAWRVRARNAAGLSAWSRTLFNVVQPVTSAPIAPALISPQANAILETGTTVYFTWSPVAAASSYQYTLVNLTDDTFEGPTAFVPSSSCTAEQCSIGVELDLLQAETYQWQVSASNAAGNSDWASANFAVIPAATQRPDVPAIVSPQSGAQLVAGTSVTFEWEADPHAVAYEFHFFDSVIGETSPYVQGLFARDVCSGNLCSTTQNLDVSIGTQHAWRVRGQNSMGYSEWSRTLFEAIEPITAPPAAFTLLSPAFGTGIIQGSTIQFRWQRALRATEFDIFVFDGSAPESAPFTTRILAGSCGAEQCQYNSELALPISENHQWQISARNPLGETLSELSAFSVALEAVEPPATPTLTAPDTGALIIRDASVSFQWQAVSNATAYDFYLTDAINGALPTTEDLLPTNICVESLCTHNVQVDLPLSDLHTWHVRAKQGELASQWSQRGFTMVNDAGDAAPVAQISIEGFAAEAAGLAPLQLTFNALESSDDIAIESYIWDFNDGSEPITHTTSEPITHEYTEPGSYTVRLTVTDAAGLSSTASTTVTAFDPAITVSANEASRLLSQASFGPTRDSMLDVQSLGIENWLEQQFTLQGPAHLGYVQIHSNGSSREARHEVWWRDVVEGDDQLRQRVAFALSQIFVVSDTGYTLANSQYGITNYYDILREHAFGNYRELLEQVTLNPIMGLYLSMLQNARNDPAASTRADENYAREILQLFSIGLHNLNIDGTTDGSPVFTQNQIEAFAHVFTGWNYADAGRWDRQPFTGADLISPMRPFEAYHDTDEKVLLNNAIAPAGLSAREDLAFALDNIFNHPNVGPFIGKQLIKRLVTSNPSPVYVERVARTFNDNGEGVRGDLKAVIRAILLDDEARSIPDDFVAYGKLREPVLRLSNLWRAFNVQRGNASSIRGEYNTGSPQLMDLDIVTGQAVLKSPSVFNFFQPTFSPAGPVADANLAAPEFEIFTDSNELATTNRIDRQIQEFSISSATSDGLTSSYLDFTYEVGLADDIPALLAHLNTLLLGGNMSESLASILVQHLGELPSSTDGLSQRVRDAVTLIMASPDYLVQM